MPEPQPWWAVPLMAGMFTLLGALLSQTVTLLLEHRRNRREDARRWEKERREAYAKFGAVASRFHETPENVMPLMHAFFELEMIGSPAPTQAASDYLGKAAAMTVAAGRMLREGDSGQPWPDGMRQAEFEELSRLRAVFIHAVRKEMGLPDRT